MRCCVAENTRVGLFLFGLDLAFKTDALITVALLDDVGKTVECTAADEEDVFGVDLNEFLIRMLTSALRRNVCDSSFKDL